MIVINKFYFNSKSKLHFKSYIYLFILKRFIVLKNFKKINQIVLSSPFHFKLVKQNLFLNIFKFNVYIFLKKKTLFFKLPYNNVKLIKVYFYKKKLKFF